MTLFVLCTHCGKNTTITVIDYVRGRSLYSGLVGDCPPDIMQGTVLYIFAIAEDAINVLISL